jgi:hypothetical protein
LPLQLLAAAAAFASPLPSLLAIDALSQIASLPLIGRGNTRVLPPLPIRLGEGGGLRAATLFTNAAAKLLRISAETVYHVGFLLALLLLLRLLLEGGMLEGEEEQGVAHYFLSPVLSPRGANCAGLLRICSAALLYGGERREWW